MKKNEQKQERTKNDKKEDGRHDDLQTIYPLVICYIAMVFRWP